MLSTQFDEGRRSNLRLEGLHCQEVKEVVLARAPSLLCSESNAQLDHSSRQHLERRTWNASAEVDPKHPAKAEDDRGAVDGACRKYIGPATEQAVAVQNEKRDEEQRAENVQVFERLVVAVTQPWNTEPAEPAEHGNQSSAGPVVYSAERVR